MANPLFACSEIQPLDLTNQASNNYSSLSSKCGLLFLTLGRCQSQVPIWAKSVLLEPRRDLVGKPDSPSLGSSGGAHKQIVGYAARARRVDAPHAHTASETTYVLQHGSRHRERTCRA